MPESPVMNGIHHVTAITADAQTNIDFYCGVLGLRLVKLTVNFDDPGSYHLYYGDEQGSPGTAMTFFVWPGASHGRIGPPQVITTSFAVPENSLDFWANRLEKNGKLVEISERFGTRMLSFADPDGLQLELAGISEANGAPWGAGPVPVEHAIGGFHSVTMAVEKFEPSAHLLTEQFGCESIGADNDVFRYRAQTDRKLAAFIDIRSMPNVAQGAMGAGVVHHVAFNTPDDTQQGEWRKRLTQHGFNVTSVRDRRYFHSIYFREPGGVLFEIATEGPGFTVDETVEELGSTLQLPPWLESQREQIERALPPVHAPAATR